MMKNAIYLVFVHDNWATASTGEDHRLWLNVSEPQFFFLNKSRINLQPRLMFIQETISDINFNTKEKSFWLNKCESSKSN